MIECIHASALALPSQLHALQISTLWDEPMIMMNFRCTLQLIMMPSKYTIAIYISGRPNKWRRRRAYASKSTSTGR